MIQSFLEIISLAVVVLVLYFLGWWLWKNRRIRATECGHRTKINDWLFAFGERSKLQVPVKNNMTLYCHKCLESMTIQCAWCGRPIFIGSPVTLYSLFDTTIKMPWYAVQYDKENNSYVGCTHWECEPMSACDRAGFWYPPGVVERVPTPIEMCLMDIKNGGDGVIIIDDISKP